MQSNRFFLLDFLLVMFMINRFLNEFDDEKLK